MKRQIGGMSSATRRGSGRGVGEGEGVGVERGESARAGCLVPGACLQMCCGAQASLLSSLLRHHSASAHRPARRLTSPLDPLRPSGGRAFRLPASSTQGVQGIGAFTRPRSSRPALQLPHAFTGSYRHPQYGKPKLACHRACITFVCCRTPATQDQSLGASVPCVSSRYRSPLA